MTNKRYDLPVMVMSWSNQTVKSGRLALQNVWSLFLLMGWLAVVKEHRCEKSTALNFNLGPRSNKQISNKGLKREKGLHLLHNVTMLYDVTMLHYVTMLHNVTMLHDVTMLHYTTMSHDATMSQDVTILQHCICYKNTMSNNYSHLVVTISSVYSI